MKAWGKVILLGEHAVVHGHAALAAAIDRGVELTAVASEELRLVVPEWGLDVRGSDDHPVARAVAAIAAELGAAPARLEGRADLPAAAGLGSSAALSVAVARALGAETVERVIEAAMAGERQFHGNPSGVDVALSARGGLGLYRKATGLAPVSAAPLTVVVALSGQVKQTAAMVARVAEAVARDPRAAGWLAELGAAAEEGARCVVDGELARLGALMTRAHRLLADLGVSTPVLDGLVDDALAAGALGAKLTGGGGGGAVLALAPGEEASVLGSWRARGTVTFACRIGCT